MRSSVDPVRLGLAGGIILGFSLFVVTLVSLTNHYAQDFLGIMISIYPGYSISAVGSLIGFFYGFTSTFLSLFFLGWIYNILGIQKD